MNILKKLSYFLIHVEKHQQYSSNIESDPESENEIEHLGTDSHHQLQIKNDYLKQLQKTKEQSLKKIVLNFQ